MSFLAKFRGAVRMPKMFGLPPNFIVVAIFGGLIALIRGSAVAPFIYTIF